MPSSRDELLALLKQPLDTTPDDSTQETVGARDLRTLLTEFINSMSNITDDGSATGLLSLFVTQTLDDVATDLSHFSTTNHVDIAETGNYLLEGFVQLNVGSTLSFTGSAEISVGITLNGATFDLTSALSGAAYHSFNIPPQTSAPALRTIAVLPIRLLAAFTALDVIKISLACGLTGKTGTLDIKVFISVKKFEYGPL